MSNALNTKITYIGHSTALIQGEGLTILTDPNFSPNISLVKRKGALNFNPAGLPELDAVLISHTHLDHLDFASFAYIKTTVPIVVPEGSGRLIGKFLPNPVIELAHWADHQFGSSLKIHSMPAVHPSRIICPYRYKNAAGYIIELGRGTVFFSGDTSYGQHFRDIGNTFTIDAALLPIGCYRPTFFMKRYHLDPSDALQAFVDLGARVMIPIHWGSFQLSLEKLGEPVEWLKRAASERGLEDSVKILTSGEFVEL